MKEIRQGPPTGRSTFRMAGVPVTLQPSVLVLVAMVAALQGWRMLPGAVPNADVLAYVLGAATVSVLFVASVLAHELGHVLVARRHGVRAEGVRLSLLGGVTSLPEPLVSPAAVARVAAAGPAVSLVLGGGFYGLALLADSGGATVLGMGATWLGYGNLSIGVLNLLPGVPSTAGTW